LLSNTNKQTDSILEDNLLKLIADSIIETLTCCGSSVTNNEDDFELYKHIMKATMLNDHNLTFVLQTFYKSLLHV